MQIIPAIDLIQGQCVRLRQGQFDQQTTYSASPQALVKNYLDQGAKRIHLVDLDGAKQGRMQQLDLISQLKALGGEIQVGGGIRSLDTAQTCSAAKLDFLVLGSIAIDDRQLTREMIDIIGPERIILALDITIQNQQPLIATHGWQQQSDQSLWTVVEHYAELGVWNYLCTDIAQDGMMAGPNFELYSQAVKRYPTLDWQASGGIRNPDDVCRLASSGMSAVILGRCLYESQYSLQDFIAAATAEGVTSC